MERVTIYGRMSCGFCVRAKLLCEQKNLDHKFVDMIGEGISKADLARTLGKPVMTVPQIVVGDAYIGGYTEFARFIEERSSGTLGRAAPN
ncbi:GrxA family glutaredoxin [Marinobacter nanhaiticus D15-8W]|uniref:GrxA family glutaredoxin n=1 Tax=Marinobacter nanhaiticus D15-8W TaxID=626887 RepID=N6X044_9GAMM|nr:GrxA family glutaredoxin [Marinobacter nanhaiticus]ENO16807.1 GrxA family glutaredoxin [Marinobacter nanhaiticus D15-8W]BES72622.1 GrxA family glutaredoxin [Marinobacter nanhaiticus D15-8W]